MKRYLIIIHPHFTLPGGAGKLALEIGSRLTNVWEVITVAQQVKPAWIKAYPNVRFKSTAGPITSSLVFWLLFPYWYWHTARIINDYRKLGEVTIFCNVFPAQWLGLTYKWLHPTICCVWYCHEPSAFIYIAAWKNSIQSKLKRYLAKILQPVLAWIDKRLVNLADVIFTNSVYTQKYIQQIYQRSSIVVYPGVTLLNHKLLPMVQREKMIMTVGRLTKFKRIDVLINAFNTLQHQDYKLYIIGDGEEHNNIIKLVEQYNLSDSIKVLTNVNDATLQQYYAAAKLFVSCAKQEPFGMTLIEAMAHGLPVIADNSGGPKEIVQNNVTGKLIDCTVEQLRTCIDKLLDQPDTLQQYSEQARLVVHKKFIWQEAVQQIQSNLVQYLALNVKHSNQKVTLLKRIINQARFLLKVVLGKEVLFSVQTKIPQQFFGSKKYGGWVINPVKINKDSIIYSFGIGEDISFDLALIEKFNCKVFAFDPTPKSINWLKQQQLPKNFFYYEYGLASQDGFIKLFPPKNSAHVSHSIIQKDSTKPPINVQVLRLQTIMKQLGHQHIDILKMDIEGSEYEVLDDILRQNLDIDQILIEFHHRFSKISVAKTKKAIRQLNQAGYKIFSISASREEYSFYKNNTKILQVIPYFVPAYGYGGPVKVCFDVSKELVQRGYNVTVATTDTLDDKRRIKQLDETIAGVRILRFKNVSNRFAKKYNAYLPISFYFWFKKNVQSFDLVYCHDFFTLQNVIVSHFCKKYSVPYFIQPHGALSPIRQEAKFKNIKKHFINIFQIIFTNAKGIVALTKQEKQDIILINQTVQDKIHIIPNGLDGQEFEHVQKVDLHQKFFIPKENKIIGYIGRVQYIKGIDITLEILNLLKDKMKFTFLIIGPNEGEKEKLEKIIKKLELQNNIIFTGMLVHQEKLETIKSCDLFMFTSRNEGFSMTILEIARLGIPQIISTNCNIPEIGEHQAGFVLDSADKKAFVDTIILLSTDAAKYKQMSENAKMLVKSHFSLKAVCDKIEELL
ncbi:MAG: FkbM family methyltransferase [Patescibacteria group bacterium]|jgi:FkbM family methyltransferase